MRLQVRACRFVWTLLVASGGCVEANPLHGPPRSPDEDTYTDLVLRQPQRATDGAPTREQAQAAWDRGARTGSLVLAVAALETAEPAPRLLGLAAAAAGSVRPRVRSETWLPDCTGLRRTLRRDRSVCLGEQTAWVQRGADPWKPLGLGVRDAVWTEDEGLVLLGSGRVETLDGDSRGEGSPDGTLLATNGTVFLHDGDAVRALETGEVLADGARAVARARSGAAFAVLGVDTVQVFDLGGARTLPASDACDDLLLSPLGEQVACVGPSGIEVLTGPAAGALWSIPVTGPAAISEAGALSVATTEGEVAWRTPEGAVHRFSSLAPLSLTFDSDALAVHTRDGRLRTWELAGEDLGAIRAEPTAALHRVRGRILQVLQSGEWQVVTSNRQRTVSAGSGPTGVTAAALHPAWTHAALASSDAVTVVSTEGRPTPPVRHAWSAPRAVAWSRRDDQESLSVLDGEGLHWIDGTALRDADTQGLDTLSWRRGLAWVSGAERVERWPATPGGLAQALWREGTTAAVPVPALDAVLFSAEGTVTLQGTDGTERWTAPVGLQAVGSAAPTPKGARLALGGSEGRVAVVDQSGVCLLETPPLGDHAIRSLVWSTGGRLLALDASGTLHLVDTSVLDLPADRLWGRLAWSAGQHLGPEATVQEVPWRVSPPALAEAAARDGVP